MDWIRLNKIVDSIQAKLIRKNDLSLINFYCENKNKILTNSQVTELSNIPDLNAIANLKVNIDKMDLIILSMLLILWILEYLQWKE